MYARPTLLTTVQPLIGAPRLAVISHGNDELGSWLSSIVSHVGISKDAQRGIVTAAAASAGGLVGGPAGAAIAGSLANAAQKHTSTSDALNAAVVPATPLASLAYQVHSWPRWPLYVAGALALAGGAYLVMRRRGSRKS